MRIFCTPEEAQLRDRSSSYDVGVRLFHRPTDNRWGHSGAPVLAEIGRRKIHLDPHAWDLMSIGLSVIAADVCCQRSDSPDGWTRDISLTIAVGDANYWSEHQRLIEEQLQFLTTDRWTMSFVHGGLVPNHLGTACIFNSDCVSLLSGGLDSLIGGLDLTSQGKVPLLVSQVAQGDKDKQREFANRLGLDQSHLQLSHDARSPLGKNERSQRARSFIFLVYGVIGAMATSSYRAGGEVDLLFCENGFISINPPLTLARVGSLSTRTTHPSFIGKFQDLLTAIGFRVRLRNTYQYKTKGEMLQECLDQEKLRQLASTSTSCGRFGRHGYQHCGRCIPCLIRRAAFDTWSGSDETAYRYAALANRPISDDVRAAAAAVVLVRNHGIEKWLGASLVSPYIDQRTPYVATMGRGLAEIEQLIIRHRVI